MKVLKAIGKFFGGLFILFAITAFLVASLGSYGVKNVNLIEEKFSSLEDLPADNPITERINQEINDFTYYGGMMKIIAFVFFIVGVLLFIWCSGWLTGLRNASLISFIGILFSYFYYKFAIIGAINSFLPPEFIEFFGDWINVTLNQVINLILTLGVIFLILTIALYILTHRIKLSKKVLKK